MGERCRRSWCVLLHSEEPKQPPMGGLAIIWFRKRACVCERIHTPQKSWGRVTSIAPRSWRPVASTRMGRSVLWNRSDRWQARGSPDRSPAVTGPSGNDDLKIPVGQLILSTAGVGRIGSSNMAPFGLVT
jgi:hypothetical protein